MINVEEIKDLSAKELLIKYMEKKILILKKLFLNILK